MFLIFQQPQKVNKENRDLVSLFSFIFSEASKSE